MIFFGADSLRRALHEHALHYGSERNHQGIGNNLIAPEGTIGSTEGKMRCRSRLGGMFNYYYRDAACSLSEPLVDNLRHMERSWRVKVCPRLKSRLSN